MKVFNYPTMYWMIKSLLAQQHLLMEKLMLNEIHFKHIIYLDDFFNLKIL